MSSDPSAHARFTLFGEPQLTINGQLRPLPTAHARRLLAVLALTAPQTISRTILSGLFWPDMPQRRAGHNLAVTFFRLRQALAHADDLLYDDGQALGLQPQRWRCDITQADALQQQIEQHTHRTVDRCLPCLAAARQLIALMPAPLWPTGASSGNDELNSWFAAERERFQQQLTTALLAVARSDLRGGRYASAIQLLQRAVELEPWNDDGVLLLMQALAADESAAAALAAFTRYRTLLSSRFDLQPDARIRQLADDLRAGTFHIPPPARLARHGLPADFAADHAAPAAVDAVIDAVIDAAAQPSVTLISLVGGTARQRAAVLTAAAESLADTCDDGALLTTPAAVDNLTVLPGLVALYSTDSSGAALHGVQQLRLRRPALLILYAGRQPLDLWTETVIELTAYGAV